MSDLTKQMPIAVLSTAIHMWRTAEDYQQDADEIYIIQNRVECNNCHTLVNICKHLTFPYETHDHFGQQTQAENFSLTMVSLREPLSQIFSYVDYRVVNKYKS